MQFNYSDNEIHFINESKSRCYHNKYQYGRLQTNKNETQLFKCNLSTCKSTITLSKELYYLSTGKFQHDHPPKSLCEMAIEIEYTKIRQKFGVDADLTFANNSYHKLQKDLYDRFSLKEVVDTKLWVKWQPTFVKSLYKRHARYKENKDNLKKNENKENDSNYELDEIYSTINNQPFLRYDSKENNRIMIFTTNECISTLNTSSQWHLDGTFKTVPKEFYQVMTIHAVKKYKSHNVFILCAKILLKRKDRETYNKAFEELIKILSPPAEFDLKRVFTDFELALHQSLFKILDKNVEIKGCWFHFNQAIIRKLISLGLLGLYCGSIEFKTWIRRLSALALIPIEFIEEGWNYILSSFPNSLDLTSNIIEFIDYFIKTWLNAKPGSGPQIWNCHESTIRTNNHLEGFHSGINRSLSAHGSLNNFISHFQKLFRNSHDTIEKMKQNHDLKLNISKQEINKDLELELLHQEFKQTPYSKIVFNEYFDKITNYITHSFGQAELNQSKIVEDEIKTKPREKIIIPNSFRTCIFSERIDYANCKILPETIVPSHLMRFTQNHHANEQIKTGVVKQKRSYTKRKEKDNNIEYQTIDEVIKQSTNTNKESFEVANTASNSIEIEIKKEKFEYSTLNPEAVKRRRLDIKFGDQEIYTIDESSPDPEPSTLILPIPASYENDESTWLFESHVEEVLKDYRLANPNIAFLSIDRLVEIYGRENYFLAYDFSNLYAITMVVKSHWVLLTNIDNSDSSNTEWLFYESLNDDYYAKSDEVSILLSMLHCDKTEIDIYKVDVEKQKGTNDCGLFVLAYLKSLLTYDEPGIIRYDQSSFRKIYNDYILAKQSLQSECVALPRFDQNIGCRRDSNGNLMKTRKAKKITIKLNPSFFI